MEVGRYYQRYIDCSCERGSRIDEEIGYEILHSILRNHKHADEPSALSFDPSVEGFGETTEEKQRI